MCTVFLLRCCKFLHINDDPWPHLSHLASHLGTHIRLYSITNWVSFPHDLTAQWRYSCLNDWLFSLNRTDLNFLDTAFSGGSIRHNAVFRISFGSKEAALRAQIRPRPSHISSLPDTFVSVASIINILVPSQHLLHNIFTPSPPLLLQAYRHLSF